jgi:C-terminal processing protease CtpA/Prc
MAWAGPSAIPASLKTLESVLSSVRLPSPGVGAGLQPLENAVAAADGLLRSLDPHGFSGATSKKMETSSESGRTGIVLGRLEGYVVVAGTLPDSPAHATALREGDRLLSIGEQRIPAGMSLSAVEKALSGKVGETVEVHVLHADGKGVATHSLKFAEVKSSVQVRILPGKVGYVQLTGPVSMSLAEYKLKLRKIQSEDMVGVVLDFRGAWKGGAEEAVTLCEPFLGPTRIATVLDGRSQRSEVKTSAGALIKVPVVVILGPSTRGAGEIAAAAFQAKKRAVLLGAATQGMAPDYRHVEKAGVFLTLPESMIEAPDGTMLTGRGLRPDIVVEVEPVPAGLAESFAGQEIAFSKGEKWTPPKKKTDTDKDLESALKEDGKEKTPPKTPELDAEKEKDANLAPRDPFHEYVLLKRFDPRLVRSVHLLMAASIFSQQKLN